MAGSTHKKVLVRRLDGQAIEGFASPQTYLRPEGVEVLTRDGQATVISYNELKAVYFVREFDVVPEPDEKKVFQSRPKLGGLWVRLRFRDDDVLEGIAPNDLLQVTDQGLTITPPDPYSNNQKIFVPRLALRELTVLGVIGSPITKARRARRAAAERQIDLFDQ